MSGDRTPGDDFERVLRAALAVEERPHLVAARIGQALDRRRESADLWRLFAPGRIALIGALGIAAGIGLGFLVPAAGFLDTDLLMAAAYSGGFS